jgi:hypothetical protein
LARRTICQTTFRRLKIHLQANRRTPDSYPIRHGPTSKTNELTVKMMEATLSDATVGDIEGERKMGRSDEKRILIHGCIDQKSQREIRYFHQSIRTLLILCQHSTRGTPTKIEYVMIFRQATIEREIYMRIPRGFNIDEGETRDFVLKLHRNTYGQKAGKSSMERIFYANFANRSYVNVMYHVCIPMTQN